MRIVPPAVALSAVLCAFACAPAGDREDRAGKLSELTGDSADPKTADAANDDGAEARAVAAGCDLNPSLPGDTRPCTDLRYPEEAFATNGGRVLNVKTRFGAKGDGKTDDTKAITLAYDYVVQKLKEVGFTGFFQKTNEASFVLYFPEGTYLVSDSLVYSGPRLTVNGAQSAEIAVQLRFVGQSREKTVIRLKEGAPGFDAESKPKPVLAFGKGDFNNTPGSNSLRNMTIRVGRGNRGAIGVHFGGANQSDVQNVSIVSEDGGGVAGLDNAIGSTLSYQRDITVQGFDYGIRLVPYHFTEPAIEHVTLGGQRKAGVQFVDGTGSLRMIKSDNEVPAVLVSGSGAHAVVLDSSFTGGARARAALEVAGGKSGHLFARNVGVGGYGCAVRKGATCERPTALKGASCAAREYVSDTPIGFSPVRPQSLCSLDLPVEEVPTVPVEPDERRWARPTYTAADFASGVDASPSIQAAMTRGCPQNCPSTVYLPTHEYAMRSPVTVPCTVRRIAGLFTVLGGSAAKKLRVANACSEPLVIEDITFDGGLAVEHAALRPVVLQRVGSRAFIYDATVASGTPTVFFNMVGGIKAAHPFANVRAFLRAANAESPAGAFVIEGGAKVWLMGFKTEKDAKQFTVRDGGQLEVLGGIMNQYCQDSAKCVWEGGRVNDSLAIDVSGAASKVSIVAATNGPSSETEHYMTILEETQGTTKTIRWDSPLLAERVGRNGQVVIPLYASY